MCEHNPSVIDKKLTLPNEIVPIDFEFNGIVVAKDHTLEFTKEVSDLLNDIVSLQEEINETEQALSASGLTYDEYITLESKLSQLEEQLNQLSFDGEMCTDVDVYCPIINNGILSVGAGAHMFSQSRVINNGTFSISDSKECFDFWNDVWDGIHTVYPSFEQRFVGPLPDRNTPDFSFQNNVKLKISGYAITYFNDLQNQADAIVEVSNMSRIEVHFMNNEGGTMRFKDNSLLMLDKTTAIGSETNINYGEMYFEGVSGIFGLYFDYISGPTNATLINFDLLDLSNISNLGNFDCQIQNWRTIRLPRNVEAGIDTKVFSVYGVDCKKSLSIKNTQQGKIEYYATYPTIKSNKIVLAERKSDSLKDYIKFMGIDITPANTTFSPIENETLTLSDLASMSNINIRGAILDLPQDFISFKVEEDTSINFDLYLNADAKLEVYKNLTIYGDIRGQGTIIIQKGGSINIAGKIIGCALKNQGKLTRINSSTYQKPEWKIYSPEELLVYYPL